MRLRSLCTCLSSLFNLPDPPHPLHTPPRFGGHESTNGTYGEEAFGEDWGLKAYFYFWWATLTGQVETIFSKQTKNLSGGPVQPCMGRLLGGVGQGLLDLIFGALVV